MQNTPEKLAKHFARRGEIAVAVVFVFSLLISVAVNAKVAFSGISKKKLEADKLAVICASEIERIYSGTFFLNGIMEELILSNENHKIPNFEHLAERLLHNYPAADCIQIAPNGVISQCAPLKGNEAAIGVDLFSDEKQREEAEAAKNSGKISIAGPYKLRQGGDGFIVQLPVFDDVWKTDFWGFVSVVVRIQKILNLVDFSSIEEQNFLYSVYKIEKSGSKTLLLGSDLQKLKNPVCAKIDLPNARWEIAVSPKDSWLNVRMIAVVSTLSIMLIVLATVSAHLLAKIRADKKILDIAGIDAVTGLFSGNTARLALEKEIKYADRNKSQLAVCKIRVSGVNKSATLGFVAERILKEIRAEDIVAHEQDGDFLLILRGKYTGTDYKMPVSRIEKKLSAIKGISGVTVGLSIFPKDGDSAEKLVRAAEESVEMKSKPVSSTLYGKIKIN